MRHKSHADPMSHQPVTPNRSARQAPPFAETPKDAGAWAYDHRVGLCITVIVCLVAAIVFMTAKIVIGDGPAPQVVYIDVAQEFIQPAPPEQPEQPLDQRGRSDDFSQIRNRISNDNAGAGTGTGSGGLNSRIRDDRGTDAQGIYDEATAAQERTRANRRAYEEGLRQERAIGEGRQRSTTGDAAQGGDTRVEGRVTVSFSLANPLRHSVSLVIPAYRCRGGGELIVTIAVNRNGDVTAARVTRASSSVDDCMREAALESAFASRFNLDTAAPEKQQGTITYIFIPQ